MIAPLLFLSTLLVAAQGVSWQTPNIWFLEKTPKMLNALINENQDSRADFNITKLLSTTDAKTAYDQIMPYFDPEAHVQENAAFAKALMAFKSERFNFELKLWPQTQVTNEKTQKYMGLGLMESQILAYRSELTILLDNVHQPSVFVTKQNICQKVLQLSTKFTVLHKALHQMPELITCATYKELDLLTSKWDNFLMEEKIAPQIEKLDDIQKDSLMRLSVGKWKPAIERRPALAEFLFHNSNKLVYHRVHYPAQVIPTFPAVTRLFIHSTIDLWEDEQTQLMSNLLRCYTPHQVVSNFGKTKDSDIPALTRMYIEKSQVLCDHLSLYQKHLIYTTAYDKLKINQNDKTPWSSDDERRLGCLLNPQIEPSYPRVIQAPNEATDWDTFHTLDALLEHLFFHGSEIRTRQEAMKVSQAIRSLFVRQNGVSKFGLSKLKPYQMYAVPAFILREFTTSEFDFSTGKQFELCTETFTRIGAIDNSDLTPEKRAKLAESFVSSCGSLFEDNMRILNTLACDYPPYLFDASIDEPVWKTRVQNCTITHPLIKQDVWQHIKERDLSDIVFTLGPKNLCGVMPEEDVHNMNVSLYDIDRLAWTFSHMTEWDDHSCEATFAVKMRNTLAEAALLQNHNPIEPCEDIRILASLNQHLEDDWLSAHDDLNSPVQCANLIGSHVHWFTPTQLALLADASVNLHVTRSVVRNEKERKLMWELDNLIPYLNYTALDEVLKSEEFTPNTALFLANIKWPNDRNFALNAKLVTQRTLETRSFGSADIVELLGNILCALTREDAESTIGARKVKRFHEDYFCTQEGSLIKSPKKIERYMNQDPKELLLPPPELPFLTTDLVNLDGLPNEALEMNLDYLVNSEWQGISPDQARFLNHKYSSAMSTEQVQQLKRLLNSGEDIELYSPEEEEETPADQEYQNNSIEEFEYEYQQVLYYNIIYIEASSQKLTAFVSLILANFSIHLL